MRLNLVRSTRAAAVLLVAVGGALGPAGASVAADPGDFLNVNSMPLPSSFENLAPGDDMSWFVTVSSSASFAAALTLTLESMHQGALMTDADLGLQITLALCDAVWTGAVDPVCGGTRTEIMTGALAVMQGGYTLPVLPPRSTAHYLAQIEFPYAATNDFALLNDDLVFHVVAGDDSVTSPGPTSGETPRPSSPPLVSTGDGGVPTPGGLPALLSTAGVTLLPLALGAALVGAGAVIVRRARRRRA
ncbi:hypothetical protein E3T55_15305 [Cryobacterium frigoriphilum]|uniref:Gram-positive cocci surface proteins LPxTG domain-containing protein n=1 Tax=Cryobacterium frigoriphilum TaxID=1259150 RepID=A0A4R8ZVN6_9MICO|nr:hypothetical protein [Cryobacterium frigoriphilum]TFD47311.1 hypothetical protein E3T55_15305 [Cryobacterium frigoriphilum]